MDAAKIKTIVMFLLSLFGFGTAGLNGGQIAWQGFEGDITQWLLLAAGSGGGVLTLIMGTNAFKAMKPPSVEATFGCVTIAAKYFEHDPEEIAALTRMARKLGEARIKPPPDQKAENVTRTDFETLRKELVQSAARLAKTPIE